MTPFLPDNPRDRFIWYASQFIGTPYIFGGDDPMRGFDCSGYVIECLCFAGEFERGDDMTAHGLYLELKSEFKVIEAVNRRPGCLVFRFREGKARHVAILISRNQILHAGGGGSATNTLKDAIDQNAYIKGDQLARLGESVKFCDPFKEGNNG